MKELLSRLASRKLWLAVGGFITLIVSEQYMEATALLLGYFGVNTYENKK